MRKGGREGWRVKKGGEGGSERGMGGGGREGRRDGEREGGKEGRREGGKEGRRMGTRAKPGNQLVYHICIHLLNPHWPMPRQAVISTQQHKLSH